jgi:hypothetical protein
MVSIVLGAPVFLDIPIGGVRNDNAARRRPREAVALGIRVVTFDTDGVG